MPAPSDAVKELLAAQSEAFRGLQEALTPLLEELGSLKDCLGQMKTETEGVSEELRKQREAMPPLAEATGALEEAQEKLGDKLRKAERAPLETEICEKLEEIESRSAPASGAKGEKTGGAPEPPELDFGRFGEAVERAFETTVGRLEGALTDLLTTGRFDLTGLAAEVQSILTRGAVQEVITDPLRDIFKPDGLTGLLGDLFGGKSEREGLGSFTPGAQRLGLLPAEAEGASEALVLFRTAAEASSTTLSGDLTRAFSQSAVTAFGEISASQLAAQGLVQVATASSLAATALNALSSAASQEAVAALPSLFGLPGGPGASPFGPQVSGTGLEGLLSAGSFAAGGSLTVPGFGPPDSRLLMARVSPGEQVDFTPSGQQRSERRPPVVNVNITVNAQDADSFNRSLSQVAAETEAVMRRAARRNL